MKNYIEDLNKVFESRIRLGIMSILTVNEGMDFGTLKEMLDITDGNLASHIAALEKAEYIDVKKQFVGKNPIPPTRSPNLEKKRLAITWMHWSSY